MQALFPEDDCLDSGTEAVGGAVHVEQEVEGAVEVID